MPPPASREELQRRVRARQALEKRLAEGGVRYFEPANDDQLGVVRSNAKGVLAIGGNQSGKTTCGAVETVWRHLGKHPHKPVHRPPIKSWAISQELPGGGDKPHKQLEEIRRWAPREALRGASWQRSYSPGARTLHWADGGVTVFKSFDQDLLAFESDQCHWIWFDEEPTRKTIWTSCLLRLVRYRGQWMMTLTPVLSLQGQGWVEELWDRRNLPDADYRCFQLFTVRNTYLPPEEVERLQRLPEEERQVRLYGAFARLGGRVLSELDPERHYVPQFLPERSWRHYLVIDPGYRNPGAHLWAAADRDGRIWLYDEHYQAGWRPDQHMEVLHALWRVHGQPDIDVLMDPAGFDLKRTSTGAESPADAAEYLEAAARLGADWFAPRRASHADPYALRVKRYLQADMMRIGRNLTWWRWEAERWTYQRQREGLAAMEHHVPERPRDRDNHLMDCTRYLCNELPDPVQLEPPRRTAVEEHWWSRLQPAEGPWDEDIGIL